jgi:hypothetical protein
VHSIWKKTYLQTSTKKVRAQAVGMSNWRCARSSRPPQQMWAVSGIAATKIRTANRIGQYLPLDHAELSKFWTTSKLQRWQEMGQCLSAFTHYTWQRY